MVIYQLRLGAPVFKNKPGKYLGHIRLRSYLTKCFYEFIKSMLFICGGEGRRYSKSVNANENTGCKTDVCDLVILLP